jgi:hypothetical protein
MNAYRNLVLSTLFFAAPAIVLCAKPFAIALQAQSPQAAAPAPSHAFPDNSTQPTGSASPPASWPDPSIVDIRRSRDLKCSVVQWTSEPPRPALVVVCPPEEVFAPLRLFFKLSWRQDADVPGNFQALLAQPKIETKMHWTDRGDYHILLQVEGKHGRSDRKWIHFNDLIGVYIRD